MRRSLLFVSGAEIALVAAVVVRAGALNEDWTDPKVLEAALLPGLVLAPAALAFGLAAFRRWLGLALFLCVAFALVVGFLLTLARTATVAG